MPAPCLHCSQAIPARRSVSQFCCAGCEAVYTLLHDAGLQRFYKLKDEKTLPLVHYFSRKRNFDWLQEQDGFKTGSLHLSLEGIQCAACVWLIKELAKQFAHLQVKVDSSLGELHLRFLPEKVDVTAFLLRLQEFGYRTAPLQERERSGDQSILLRMGICLAIAMNTMFLTISFYLGLNQNEALLFSLFSKLNFFLSFVSFFVGGTYFISRAFLALKHRVLHFDLPIALGIVAAFSGSIYASWQHHYSALYFDTLNIFIALMLVGRYLQHRFVAKNRSRVLNEQYDFAEKVKKIEGTQLCEVSVNTLVAGDLLLLQTGDVFPVQCSLCGEEAVEINKSFRTGESEAVLVSPGELIEAGSILLSAKAAKVAACSSYDAQFWKTFFKQEKEEELSALWQVVSKYYVLFVLVAASLGGVLWFFLDAALMLPVMISILVVTCPCSLGIAIPLARSIANQRLIAEGVFVRRNDLLENLHKVKSVVCDKTGTLTLSDLYLLNPEKLESLSSEDQAVLYHMVSKSRHPASRALYHYLSLKKLPWADKAVEERVGEGILIFEKGKKYFLGRSQAQTNFSYQVDFCIDDKVRAQFLFEEDVLQDAAQSFSALQSQGYEVFLLSGDKQNRVQHMASTLGISQQHAFGEQKPEEKAAFVSQLAGTYPLFLGDVLNDRQAFANAFLSTTPLGEKTFLLEDSDFFFLSGSLAWLPKMFDIAKRFYAVLRFNLFFAAVYNLIAVGLALAGLMNPLLCAVLMPTSSLLVIALSFSKMKRKI